jgi:hypothetical protein
VADPDQTPLRWRRQQIRSQRKWTNQPAVMPSAVGRLVGDWRAAGSPLRIVPTSAAGSIPARRSFTPVLVIGRQSILS